MCSRIAGCFFNCFICRRRCGEWWDMVLLALGGEIEVSLWLGCGEVARPAKFTGGTVAAMFYPLVETEVWFEFGSIIAG